MFLFNNFFPAKYLQWGLLAFLVIGCATASPREQQLIKDAQIANAPIFWEDLNIGPPNTANGKEISWNWHNTSNKTIKYASFSFKYFNNVFDQAFCSYGAGSSVRQTGPIKPGSRQSMTFTSLCYDSNVTCGELQSVSLEFMDGNTESYSKEKLLEMNAIDTSDKCGSEY